MSKYMSINDEKTLRSGATDKNMEGKSIDAANLIVTYDGVSMNLFTADINTLMEKKVDPSAEKHYSEQEVNALYQKTSSVHKFVQMFDSSNTPKSPSNEQKIPISKNLSRENVEKCENTTSRTADANPSLDNPPSTDTQKIYKRRSRVGTLQAIKEIAEEKPLLPKGTSVGGDTSHLTVTDKAAASHKNDTEPASSQVDGGGKDNSNFYSHVELNNVVLDLGREEAIFKRKRPGKAVIKVNTSVRKLLRNCEDSLQRQPEKLANTNVKTSETNPSNDTVIDKEKKKTNSSLSLMSRAAESSPEIPNYNAVDDELTRNSQNSSISMHLNQILERNLNSKVSSATNSDSIKACSPKFYENLQELSKFYDNVINDFEDISKNTKSAEIQQSFSENIFLEEVDSKSVCKVEESNHDLPEKGKIKQFIQSFENKNIARKNLDAAGDEQNEEHMENILMNDSFKQTNPQPANERSDECSNMHNDYIDQPIDAKGETEQELLKAIDSFFEFTDPKYHLGDDEDDKESEKQVSINLEKSEDSIRKIEGSPPSSSKSSQSRKSNIINSTKKFISRNMSSKVSKSVRMFNSLSKTNRKKGLPEDQEDFTFFSLREPSLRRQRKSLMDVFHRPNEVEHGSFLQNDSHAVNTQTFESADLIMIAKEKNLYTPREISVEVHENYLNLAGGSGAASSYSVKETQQADENDSNMYPVILSITELPQQGDLITSETNKDSEASCLPYSESINENQNVLGYEPLTQEPVYSLPTGQRHSKEFVESGQDYDAFDPFYLFSGNRSDNNNSYFQSDISSGFVSEEAVEKRVSMSCGETKSSDDNFQAHTNESYKDNLNSVTEEKKEESTEICRINQEEPIYSFIGDLSDHDYCSTEEVKEYSATMPLPSREEKADVRLNGSLPALNEPVYSTMFLTMPPKSFLHSSKAPKLPPPRLPPKPTQLLKAKLLGNVSAVHDPGTFRGKRIDSVSADSGCLTDAGSEGNTLTNADVRCCVLVPAEYSTVKDCKKNEEFKKTRNSESANFPMGVMKKLKKSKLKHQSKRNDVNGLGSSESTIYEKVKERSSKEVETSGKVKQKRSFFVRGKAFGMNPLVPVRKFFREDGTAKRSFRRSKSKVYERKLSVEAAGERRFNGICSAETESKNILAMKSTSEVLTDIYKPPVVSDYSSIINEVCEEKMENTASNTPEKDVSHPSPKSLQKETNYGRSNEGRDDERLSKAAFHDVINEIFADNFGPNDDGSPDTKGKPDEEDKDAFFNSAEEIYDKCCCADARISSINCDGYQIDNILIKTNMTSYELPESNFLTYLLGEKNCEVAKNFIAYEDQFSLKFPKNGSYESKIERLSEPRHFESSISSIIKDSKHNTHRCLQKNSKHRENSPGNKCKKEKNLKIRTADEHWSNKQGRQKIEKKTFIRNNAGKNNSRYFRRSCPPVRCSHCFKQSFSPKRKIKRFHGKSKTCCGVSRTRLGGVSKQHRLHILHIDFLRHQIGNKVI